MSKAIFDEHTVNTLKTTNVTTNLSITGTTGARTIVSSDGSDAIIPIATTAVSGVMSKVIFDEHTTNTAKVGYTEALVSANTDVAANTLKLAGLISGQITLTSSAVEYETSNLGLNTNYFVQAVYTINNGFRTITNLNWTATGVDAGKLIITISGPPSNDDKIVFIAFLTQ